MGCGMGRIKGDLRERSFQFAVAIVKLVDGFPHGTKGWTIGKQVLRSGTAVGANIFEADHSMTDADFAHKCSIARKEASETQYWLQLCCETGLASSDCTSTLIDEASELTRILGAIVRTTQEYIARKNE